MLSRREFLEVASFSVVGLSSLHYSSNCAASENQYEWSPIRENVGTFQGNGGTVAWLISDDAIVVVDTSVEDSAPHLLNEIRRHSKRKIDLTVNTHHHGLHTGGNIAFKEQTGMLLAHENSKRNQELDYQRAGKRQRLFNLPEQFYPNATMMDEWTGTFGRETVVVKHFGAAHTDGDVVVHFQRANVVHLGDIFYNGLAPFFDLQNGASFLKTIRVIEKIQSYYDKDSKFICGHTRADLPRVCGMADVKAFEDFLHRTRENVEAGIKSGRSREEIVEQPFVPGAKEWIGTIKSTLTAAYYELAGHNTPVHTGINELEWFDVEQSCCCSTRRFG